MLIYLILGTIILGIHTLAHFRKEEIYNDGPRVYIYGWTVMAIGAIILNIHHNIPSTIVST